MQAVDHVGDLENVSETVARVRRLAKLRSCTCRSGAMTAGAIIATTISAQPATSFAGALSAKASASDADNGIAAARALEQNAGSIKSLPVRDGSGVKTVSAGLTVFRVAEDGRLEFVRKYDVDTSGGKTHYWMGMVGIM